MVDTIGFNDKSWISPDRGRHSEELHVVERMRFVADRTYLEDIWTVDDPKALIAPYQVRRYHQKLPAGTHVVEAVCNDTPQNRKAWLHLYKRAEQDAADDRAAAAKAAGFDPDLK